MKTYLDCIPCFVRQSHEILRSFVDDDRERWQIMQQALRSIADCDFSMSPPEVATRIHRLMQEKIALGDPYLEAKKRSNELALQLYPDLQARVASSDDPWATALRLAIAGNIIDLGVKNNIDSDDVQRSIDAALHQPVDDAVLDALKADIDNAESILYIGDNAGEIVFDRLFIEQLPAEKITFAVRGFPTINDALMADAEMTGMTGLVPVIDNGSDVPGTLLQDCSPEFRQAFNAADLVIAKGQGNYETLSDVPQKIYFLFKVKCQVVARDSGLPEGQIAVIKGGV